MIAPFKLLRVLSGFALLATTQAAPAQDVGSGAVVFKRCAICHSVTSGGTSIGPNLFEIVGRKAGSYPKYFYSKVMAASTLIWDKPTLDKYLAKPQEMVPGNKMAFVGLSNPKDRQDVIAYLATLKK
ncbi:c-type cytochrome [Flavisphingomonas formosensis]|uniref:c-type cytochrome n=1 Tax=Flavisphingomonas formosensis TaxID=861534 RepID=UPI0012FC364A|nr:cytochrome c family protein [Sphingomonas formosensis]